MSELENMLRRLFRHRTTIITLSCLGVCLCFVFQLDLIEIYEGNSKKSKLQAIVNNNYVKRGNLLTSFIGKDTSSTWKKFSKKNKRIGQLSGKAESSRFGKKRKTVRDHRDAFADAYSTDEHNLQVTQNEHFLRIAKRETSQQADATKSQKEDRVKRNFNNRHFRSIEMNESGGHPKLWSDSRFNTISRIKSQNNASLLQDSISGNVTSPCLIKEIYWTSSMKELLPKGDSQSNCTLATRSGMTRLATLHYKLPKNHQEWSLRPAEADNWLEIIRQNKVKSLRPPQWNQCGRPKNGIATIDGGPTVCARYRFPHNRLVLGEAMSYWLSRYLGLRNVPPVALSLVNSSQWSDVYSQVRDLGWQKDQYTALLMWISQIGSNQRSEAHMPRSILRAIKTGQPWTPKGQRHQNGCFRLQGMSNVPIQLYGQGVMRDNVADEEESVNSLVQLAQWSTMIVFDYITGNYDRVASMLDGAENENRSEILNDPMRNLPISRQTGELWLIDNESGLFDAYDLLYLDTKNGKRFHRFHRTLLHTVCVFDKTVIERVRLLDRKSHPHHFLEALSMKKDKLLRGFPIDSSHLLFEKYFPHRLREVLDWVHHCQQLFDGVV